MSANKLLIVGADSLVGAAAVAALERADQPFWASTRRADTVGGARILIDFESEDRQETPPDVGAAIIIAAATDYQRCETDPQARAINVELIPEFAVTLMRRGIRTYLISTNSVFGGDAPWPAEDAPHAPGIEYARQKSESEARMRALAETAGVADRLGVIRLTKIINDTVPPIPGWINAWAAGEAVTPFEDLIFAPISTTYVAQGLIDIAGTGTVGDFHLSGADNISYVAFAEAMARRLDLPAAAVAPTTSEAKGVKIHFKPRFSGLGMSRTERIAGVAPQTLEALMDDIAPALRTLLNDARAAST